jgi:hypothetical protein
MDVMTHGENSQKFYFICNNCFFLIILFKQNFDKINNSNCT